MGCENEWWALLVNKDGMGLVLVKRYMQAVWM